MPACPFCAKSVPDGATICPHCLRAQPITIPSSRQAGQSSGSSGRGRMLVLLLLVAGLGAYLYHEHRERIHDLFAHEKAPVVVAAPAPAPAAGPTMAAPLDLHIADTASVVIAPGQYLSFPFSGDGRTGCHVQGGVRVLSGGDRRVSVMIVDRDGVAALEAGHAPQTFYDSGPMSDVKVERNVDGRTSYTLVVANTAAKAKPKTVRLQNLRAHCTD
jgi:hypothetical protein